ncbi:MAG: hypothetical protein WC716_16595 [Chitinophagaceae bacterium]|jgi:hypothetical protein
MFKSLLLILAVVSLGFSQDFDLDVSKEKKVGNKTKASAYDYNTGEYKTITTKPSYGSSNYKMTIEDDKSGFTTEYKVKKNTEVDYGYVKKVKIMDENTLETKTMKTKDFGFKKKVEIE